MRNWLISLTVVCALTACGKSTSTAEPAAPAAGAESTAAVPTTTEPVAAPAEVPSEPAAPAATTETAAAPAPLPPVAAVITHKVKDFDAWKVAFDSHQAARKEAGITGHHLSRGLDDPNLVVIYLPATDVEKLKAFAASPDLKAKMKEAGVIGKPAVEIINPVETRNAEDPKSVAALIGHDVKDYDAWKTAFDAHAEAREQAAMTGVTVNRDSEKPNHVLVYAQSSDAAKLKEFVASKDLKAKMKEAGVKGKPSITLLQGIEWVGY